MGNQEQIASQQTALVASKQNLKSLLSNDQVSLTLERVCTRWMSPDQFRTQAVLAVARNSNLLRCTQHSFLESMVRAAELGLRFAGAGGEAYLVPYKNACVLIIGYRGLCALARRTGRVTRIEARCVREKDYFKVSFGSGQQITHRPHLGADCGEITCVYALAQLRDGSIQLEVMSRSEVDGIRKRSKAANNGPWVTDYEQMCRKTALRRLCKFLPFPTAYDDALAAEDPAISEDQPRRQVDAIDIPENVNIQTGEIEDEQPEAVSEKEIDQAGFEHFEPSGPSDLDNKKSKLIDQIVTQLGKLHPGNSVEAQAGSLKTLKYIFGKVQLDEIAKLPVQILEAGLGAMRSQAAANEKEEGY